MPRDRLDRIGLVVHPRRRLDAALGTISGWAAEQRAEVVQVRTSQHREVAPPGEAADCDLIIALGGDGTALAALHAAAPVGRPVLGVACGSLGALTAVTADRLARALDRVAAGDWTARALPALVAEGDGGRLSAINDLVLVRRGAGQVLVELDLDGERLIRFAGDGLIAATPLGSTAYTLAAGGPMLAPGCDGLVLTPLAPHAGVCPPVVVPAGTRVTVRFDPGAGGARVEIDGQVRREAEPLEPLTFELACTPAFVALVSLGGQETALAGLRRRRILLDSARIVARDEREEAAARRAAAAP